MTEIRTSEPSSLHPTVSRVVVRVDTDQDGLYGIGCATFTHRPTLVAAAVDDYLARQSLWGASQAIRARSGSAQRVCANVHFPARSTPGLQNRRVQIGAAIERI